MVELALIICAVLLALAIVCLGETWALKGRDRLWREATNQRLANQQGDVLRIEQKLDEAHFLSNVTMGAFSEALDNANITVGALACDVAREKKHADVVSTAGELILSTIRVLRDRIEKLEQRADEADQQIKAICDWGRAMDEWVKGPGGIEYQRFSAPRPAARR